MTELNDTSGLIGSLAAIRDARLSELVFSIDELLALGLVTHAGDGPSLTVDGQQLLQLAALAAWGSAGA